VRTLLIGSPCPVCGRVALSGRQTACSARCRRERSRQKDAARRQQRDEELRGLARAVRDAAEALEQRLLTP